MIINILLCLVCFFYAGFFLFREYDVSFFNDTVTATLNNDLILGLLFSILFANFIVIILKKKPVGETSKQNTAGSNCDAEVAQNILYLISMLQEKGRLLDFVMDDISTYRDEDVGRVSRIVHQGVKEVFTKIMDIKSIHAGVEGEKITLNGAADFSSYKLIGTGTKTPPLTGVVVHKGWKLEKFNLPKISSTVDQTSNMIIQAVEVEVK